MEYPTPPTKDSTYQFREVQAQASDRHNLPIMHLVSSSKIIFSSFFLFSSYIISFGFNHQLISYASQFWVFRQPLLLKSDFPSAHFQQQPKSLPEQ